MRLQFYLGLLAGLVFGSGLALLFVPRSGAETRHRISEAARGTGDRARNLASGVREKARSAKEAIVQAI